MKNLIIISLFSIVLFFLMNQKEESNIVTDINDYEKYINTPASNSTESISLEKSIFFWEEKLSNEPSAGLYKHKLAMLLSQRFKLKGDVDDIRKSDSLLLQTLDTYLFKKSPVLHALAANSISQHKFQEALDYGKQALETGEDRLSSYLVIFDACLELGEVKKAQNILTSYPNKNSFGYMIREVKMEDAKGNLDKAINIMEKAAESVDAKRQKDLYCWAKSNLGDMYGHAGKLDKSYECYLQVLQENPSYLYALKGIAWLAYSNDGDISRAKDILEYLQRESDSPDSYLLLAEIAAYNNDSDSEIKLTADFLNEVKQLKYGSMYNKYIIQAKTEVIPDLPTAQIIAEMEIKNRASVQSYDLLAWTYYKSNNPEQALNIAKRYIEGKSFEPEILYHLGLIFKETGNNDKALHYLSEANDASFELGPMVSSEIEKQIQTLKTI